jgi:murein L,D-transpeptidase YcbB/YkuD
VRTVHRAWVSWSVRDLLDTLGDNMTALSVSEATQALTVTRAIKSRWHSASRKEDGSYEMAPAASGRRVRSLVSWHRAAEARAEAELMHRVALAEEQLADLKTALDDMRAQRDAWQAIAQARIRPEPSGQGRWPWLRSIG